MIGEYLRRLWPFFTAVTLLPFVLGAIDSFSAGLGFVLFILGVPITLAILLVGTIIWLIRGFRWAREAPGRRSAAVAVLASPALLVLPLLAAWPLLAAGRHTGDLARLALNHSRYEAIIAQAQVSPRACLVC